MDSDQKLSKKVEEYAALAKENPKVDVGLLMANALMTEKQNLVSAKAKRWAYLVSIGVPPLGLLFALRYYLGKEDDAKQVAWVCIILTVVSILLFWLGMKMFSASGGPSMQQLQQIKPSDVLQLTQ